MVVTTTAAVALVVVIVKVGFFFVIPERWYCWKEESAVVFALVVNEYVNDKDLYKYHDCAIEMQITFFLHLFSFFMIHPI